MSEGEVLRGEGGFDPRRVFAVAGTRTAVGVPRDRVMLDDQGGLCLADLDRVEVDRERHDGQLTAYEVSGKDLRGTQLVVLSACETGMGATDMKKTGVAGST